MLDIHAIPLVFFFVFNKLLPKRRYIFHFAIEINNAPKSIRDTSSERVNFLKYSFVLNIH